jgi:nucleoside-diphosphate-sugar epimerase
LRVLVTGGAGFIGSNVVDGLIDAGHEPALSLTKTLPHDISPLSKYIQEVRPRPDNGNWKTETFD